ncbi:MAG TPA: magnesium transporter [Pirellulaceae bacterium]|nr:magnesium transporter [Pirellulaceae bacterium]HMO91593.1 magnesium transporter [Pirellulaceae bacterium]HMP68290.1 magnesium transporter [Pirellulaceae bacterium]
MINTLYLPEIREALAEGNETELREFVHALHPSRTAEFMEGLTAHEAWEVLKYAELELRAEIFSYFDLDHQIDILTTQDHTDVAELLNELPADDRVDLLSELEEGLTTQILSHFPASDRRATVRLSQYPEGTAGAMMTTEVALVQEQWTVKQTLDELSSRADAFETIYYLFVVDDANRLRGVVSARQLLSAMRTPSKLIADLMERDVVAVRVSDDQETVAEQVADLDLLAIPVVDDERRMLGIITHDDVIDAVREEAVKDAHRSAAIQPLEESYLRTHLLTLSWKRGMWLSVLFAGAIFTTFLLERFEDQLKTWSWMIAFIPILISSGGNSGNQSATLVITALSSGHVSLGDWARVLWRELKMGLILGLMLGLLGFGLATIVGSVPDIYSALVLPITLIFVVLAGTMIGSTLPLIFKRIGWDPALMSNPLVASLMDFVGLSIYLIVAIVMLSSRAL